MAYPKRDWANTGNEVTKEDFKRIENGIEANDIEITKQKNPTIPGTLAKKIADNVTAIEENANKINVLNIDRGYLNTKGIGDANLATENGIYLLDVNGANSPNFNWAFTIQTIKQAGYGNRTQIAIAYYPTATPFMYMRISVNDAWGSWKEMATTESDVVTIPNNTDLATYLPTMKENKIYRQIPNTGVKNSPNPSLFCFYTRQGMNVTCTQFDGANSLYYVTNVVNNGYFGWKQIATTKSGIITLNGFAQSFTQCRVTKVGNVYTFNFSIITNGGIPSGTVVATLPLGFYPAYNFHIHPWAHNFEVINLLRAWVTTDGTIQLHGGETLPPNVHLEFSRTVIFE